MSESARETELFERCQAMLRKLVKAERERDEYKQKLEATEQRLQQHWIPVSEKLPEVHKDVRIWVFYRHDDEGQATDSWLEKDGTWALGSAKGYRVTHWHELEEGPLPSAPEKT